MFSGAYTALVTPFQDGIVDEHALSGLVEFQIQGGVSGLVIGGTTGEAATMTEAERERVLAYVVERVAGRVQVVAGTGSNDTAETIRRTQRARELGVDAAMIVAPYYNKPTQEGLFQHFAAIASAVDLPIMLYNVPGRTAVNVLPETVVRLAAIPGIAAVKEASGSIDQCSQIIRGTDDGFSLLSGDDSLTAPIMSIGGRGVVSVVGNIVPHAVSRLTSAMLQGESRAARDIHLELFDLCQAMFFDNNPTAVKTAASMLGLCGEEVRLPLTSMSSANRERLLAAMRDSSYVASLEREIAA